jgi:predicted branched-subunit amino acid permease
MGAGGSPISAIATGTLLGIRNGLYAMRLSPILKLTGLRKLLGAQITIDESTGVALSQSERGTDAMKYGFFATGIGVYIFWNLFTLFGALGASSIGDISAWGLDAAVPAAFLGLLWPRLNSKQNRIAALFAVLVATALTPLVGAGFPIIATVAIAVLFGWRSK